MVADEVTDVANKEQLSVVLRYVDPGLFKCDTGITGHDFSRQIIDCPRAYGLDPSNLHVSDRGFYSF